jgi:hypothetical protein
MPDAKGYPTDEEGKAIAAWPADDPTGFFAAVRAAWWAADWGWTETRHDGEVTLHVSTGGWSGNEELIGIMRRHDLWPMTWQATRRGGHYTFLYRES